MIRVVVVFFFSRQRHFFLRERVFRDVKKDDLLKLESRISRWEKMFSA